MDHLVAIPESGEDRQKTKDLEMRVHMLDASKKERNDAIKRLRSMNIEYHIVSNGNKFDIYMLEEGASNSVDALTTLQQRKRRTNKNNSDIIRISDRWHSAAGGFMPVTFFIIAISAVIFLFTNMGDDSARDSLMYVMDLRYESVNSQNAYRLISPSFLHFGTMHFIFNMLMAYQLIGALENRISTISLIALLLLFATVDSTASFYLSHNVLDWLTNPIKPSVAGGGMSGVLYAVFGFMWVQSSHNVRSGIYIDNNTKVSMVVWLFLCMVPQFQTIIGPIGNDAHVIGIILGLTVGFIWAVSTKLLFASRR